LHFRSMAGIGREVKQCLAYRSRGTTRPQMDSTPDKSPSNKRTRIPINPRRSPTYLRRGQNNQDNEKEATSRAYINQRCRAHRVADRHREPHSPLPSLNTAIATLAGQRRFRGSREGSRDSSPSSSPPRYLAPSPSGQGTPSNPTF
jgi:hypothetical protein